MGRGNLAGRVGAWAAANPKDALFSWAIFVAIAVALGTAAGARTISDTHTRTGESARADRALERAGLEKGGEEVVLVQLTRLGTPTARLYAAVRDVTTRLERQDAVKDIRSPLAPENAALVSWDFRSALVPFRVAGKPENAARRMKPILAAVARAQRDHPRLLVAEFGDAGTEHALDESIGKDFRRAEVTTVPVTLAILLIVFGAALAALLPVLLAFSGVLAAIGLTMLASHVFPTSHDTTSVVLLVGMAVGIDYSLFYLRRQREELARGLTRHEALLRTSATSGQAVLVSGLTVLIAMAGMFFSGSRIFTSFAVGTLAMVAVALVGALTVVPALLSLLGDRIDGRRRGRLLGRLRPRRLQLGAWEYVLERVLRRPALSAGVAAAVLLALAVPALGLHTQFPGYSDLPSSSGYGQTHDRIQVAFADPRYVGDQTPAVVAVEGIGLNQPRAHQAIRALQRLALSSGHTTGPSTLRLNKAKTVAAVTFTLKGSGNDGRSRAGLAALRDRFIPRTVGRVPGLTASVTGETAATSDFNSAMAHHMPFVFGFALSFVFLLLLVTFRSIVVPIKAVLLNLLSVGAAYGVLVAVFQHRWAEGILGFRSNGAIVSWLPMFLFVILFGLSMDYHVFILSRIKELVDGGTPTDEAVATGIRRSASTVTSAAVVMVAVFGIFASLNVLEMKQMGVGLGVAVVLDATVVRAVLLPASMKLLGEWNWYLPLWLDWLPRRGLTRAVPRPLPTVLAVSKD
jgi:RND superfamily putative drug exporter